MLVSQGANQRIVRDELGGVRFSGQGGSSDSLTSCTLDVPDKVRQRPALPDEIIDQEILLAALHLASEEGLIGEPLKAARPCMTDRIRLDDGFRNRQGEPL
ncbi:MAG: hypothetical protein JWO52_5240 [Gammaproteobacteria bacterium]|nr:hypothetical protein [Gammaproteobacteria bacterium]